MKPSALIRLAFFTLCRGLIFGPSTAVGQIGLPPTQEPPKGGKVDEQTQMQNRMREKDEMKQQMAERGEKTPPKRPAQPVQRAQRPTPKPPAPTTNLGERPKLVVGITVDQMRMDYLYRFWDAFGDDGFKRLVEKDLCAETTTLATLQHRTRSRVHLHRHHPAPMASSGTIGTIALREAPCIALDASVQTVGISDAANTAGHMSRTAWKPPQLVWAQIGYRRQSR